MSDSVHRPFPVDAILTAIAIGYRNPAHTLIGRRALPPLDVSGEVFKWLEYPLAEGFTLPELEVGRKGQTNQVEFTVEERESAIRDYGLDDPIPYSDIEKATRARAENRSTYDPRAAAVSGLTNLIELGREIRAAAVVQDPKNYATNKKITLSAKNKFSNYVDSDPYGVIDNAFDKALVFRPNTISMGQVVWSKLKRHPRLIKAVKGGLAEDGAISKMQFAELFEISISNLLIGEPLLNVTKKGQKTNLQRVWGNSIQLTYIDPTKQSSEDSIITWGFTAELGGRISGSIHDPDIGLKGGERIRVGEQVREVVCAPDIGVQIQDPV